MVVKQMSKNVNCAECRHFIAFDGIGELWTSCSVHGDFKDRKTHCIHFEKKVTKADLLKKIYALEKENEKLRQENNLSEKRIQYWQTIYKELYEKIERRLRNNE